MKAADKEEDMKSCGRAFEYSSRMLLSEKDVSRMLSRMSALSHRTCVRALCTTLRGTMRTSPGTNSFDSQCHPVVAVSA